MNLLLHCCCFMFPPCASKCNRIIDSLSCTGVVKCCALKNVSTQRHTNKDVRARCDESLDFFFFVIRSAVRWLCCSSFISWPQTTTGSWSRASTSTASSSWPSDQTPDTSGDSYSSDGVSGKKVHIEITTFYIILQLLWKVELQSSNSQSSCGCRVSLLIKYTDNTMLWLMQHYIIVCCSKPHFRENVLYSGDNSSYIIAHWSLILCALVNTKCETWVSK